MGFYGNQLNSQDILQESLFLPAEGKKIKSEIKETLKSFSVKKKNYR